MFDQHSQRISFLRLSDFHRKFADLALMSFLGVGGSHLLQDRASTRARQSTR